MDTGKSLRMRRFFRKGRTVIVPMDHGSYSGPVKGMEDIVELVKMFSKTEVDGILISAGMLARVKDVIGDLAVIARLDGTHTKLGSHLERINLVTTVEHAVKIGADMVVVNVFVGTDNEDEQLEKLGKVSTDCCKWGIPLMGEMLPVSVLYQHYEKKVKLDPKKVIEDTKLVTRVGAELGSDIIKTRYTGSVDSFRVVTRTTPVPVIVAGGPKTEGDKALLKVVRESIDAGAKGVILGRNIWQHETPTKIASSICAIVHKDLNVDDALKFLK